jgi:hypothetical protein
VRPPARQTSVRATRASAALLLAGLALATPLAGCGSEDESPEPTTGDEVIDISGTEPVGEEIAGSVAPLVDCQDWNGANREQQLATIADVRSQINLEDSGVTTPSLSDEEATDVFNDACEPAYASGFRLYLIYARAAGFKPIQDAVEEGTK